MSSPSKLLHPLFFLALFSLSLSMSAACEPEQVDPSELDERCSDGVDNNEDGLIDCADPSCALFPGCLLTQSGEHCRNGLDDNGDGKIDCEDARCADTFLCSPNLEDCANGNDDDSDGLTDCEDDACSATSVCTPGAEACTGGIDEDGDGLIDCDDSDCAFVFVCLSRPELIDNGLDDDGDGLIDCEDGDYANTGFCKQGAELCVGGLDEDSDGLRDCDDPDCALTSICLVAAEVCNNGLDDNLDGLTDCEDPRCNGAPSCRIELCKDGVDNNEDGLIDCADPDCTFDVRCLSDMTPLEICDDSLDNDGDELTDCEDPDCAMDAACQPPECPIVEGFPVCSDPACQQADFCVCDMINGAPDCSDEGCESEPACLCPAPDGVVDCSQPACAAEPDCICDMINGAPDCNDRGCESEPACACERIPLQVPGFSAPYCDSLICADIAPECQTGLPSELCEGDGVDNDGDGLIDCEDVADCMDAPYCMQLLCGDPSDNYTIRAVNDPATGGHFVIASTMEARALLLDTQNNDLPYTVLYGDLDISQSVAPPLAVAPLTFPAELGLRCVLPSDVAGETGRVRISSYDLGPDYEGLSSLKVVGGLELGAFNSFGTLGFASLNNLMAVLDDFVITDYGESPTSFHGLGSLRYIGGDFLSNLDCDPYSFDESNTYLQVNSFAGLGALNYIGHNLCFTPNASFSGFHGLNALRQIGGSLRAMTTYDFSTGSEIGMIRSFAGLDALHTIGEELFFVPDAMLSDFDGLNALTRIGGSLQMRPRQNYTGQQANMQHLSLDGLNALTYVGGALSAGSYASSTEVAIVFTDYASLGALQEIGGSFSIFVDPTFTDFTGMGALQRIGGFLSINGVQDFNTFAPVPISYVGLSGLTYLGNLNFYNVTFADFTGLSALQIIDPPISNGETTSFSFSAPQGFVDFTGMSALQKINGSASFNFYSDTGSLNGLNTLSEIAGSLSISAGEGGSLTSLNGLQGLTTIGDGLYLSYLYYVTDLTPLANLTTLDGEVYITNTGLTSLDGLQGLTTIGSLNLIDNSELTTLLGLNNVTQIAGSFSLQSNFLLQNLAALSSLTTLDGGIYFWSNRTLNDITALYTLSAFNGTDITINSNANLPQCQVDQLVMILQAPPINYAGSITSMGNNVNAVCAPVPVTP